MKPKQSTQIYYTLLQVLYWITVGLTFSYASVYLQSKGVPNSQIGLVLAAAYVLSALLQPVIAAIIDKWEIPLAKGVVVIYGLGTILALGLYFLPLPNLVVMVIMAITFSLVSALQPSVNSLAQVLSKINLPVNFGAARGTASLTYAIAMTIMGQVLNRVSPLFLPLSYGAVMVVCLLLLLAFKPIMSGRLQVRNTAVGKFPSVKEFPVFWVFLLAVFCLSSAEGFYSCFMLQMMQNIGGDSGTAGLAMGVCAAIEFPAMVLYSRISKKFGVRRILFVVGWTWLAKGFLLFAATSPMGIYLAYILQFTTYAMYIPGSIEFVSSLLPENAFLKGQSLTVSFYTLGCVCATSIGGMLLDAIGVHSTMGILLAVLFLGAVFLSIATLKKQKIRV